MTKNKTKADLQAENKQLREQLESASNNRKPQDDSLQVIRDNLLVYQHRADKLEAVLRSLVNTDMLGYYERCKKENRKAIDIGVRINDIIEACEVLEELEG